MILSDNELISVLQSEKKMELYLQTHGQNPLKIDSRIWIIHFRAPKKKQMGVLNSFFKREFAKKKILFNFMSPEILLARVYRTLKIPYKWNSSKNNTSPAVEKTRNVGLKKFQKYYNCFPSKLNAKTERKTDVYVFNESVLEPIIEYSEFKKRQLSTEISNSSSPQNVTSVDRFEPAAVSTPTLPVKRASKKTKTSRKFISKPTGKNLANFGFDKKVKRLDTAVFSESSSGRLFSPSREQSVPETSSKTSTPRNSNQPLSRRSIFQEISPNIRNQSVSNDSRLNSGSDKVSPKQPRSAVDKFSQNNRNECALLTDMSPPVTRRVLRTLISSNSSKQVVTQKKKNKTKKPPPLPLTFSVQAEVHAENLPSSPVESDSHAPSVFPAERVDHDQSPQINRSPLIGSNVFEADTRMESPQTELISEFLYEDHVTMAERNSTPEKSTPMNESCILGKRMSKNDRSKQDELFDLIRSWDEINEPSSSSRSGSEEARIESIRSPLNISFGSSAKKVANQDDVNRSSAVDGARQVPSNMELNTREEEEQEERFYEHSNPIPENVSPIWERAVPELSNKLDEEEVIFNPGVESISQDVNENRSGMGKNVRPTSQSHAGLDDVPATVENNSVSEPSHDLDEIIAISDSNAAMSLKSPSQNLEKEPVKRYSLRSTSRRNDHCGVSKTLRSRATKKMKAPRKISASTKSSLHHRIVETKNLSEDHDEVTAEQSSSLAAVNAAVKLSSQENISKTNHLTSIEGACVPVVDEATREPLQRLDETIANQQAPSLNSVTKDDQVFNRTGSRARRRTKSTRQSSTFLDDLEEIMVVPDSCAEQSPRRGSPYPAEEVTEFSPEKNTKTRCVDIAEDISPRSGRASVLPRRKSQAVSEQSESSMSPTQILIEKLNEEKKRFGTSDVDNNEVSDASSCIVKSKTKSTSKPSFANLLENLKNAVAIASKSQRTTESAESTNDSLLPGNISSQLSCLDESDDSHVFRQPTLRNSSQSSDQQRKNTTKIKKNSNAKKTKTLVDFVGYKIMKRASIVRTKKTTITSPDVSEVESQSPQKAGSEQRPKKRAVRKLFTELTARDVLRETGGRTRKLKCITSSESENLLSDHSMSRDRDSGKITSHSFESIADELNLLKLNAVGKTLTATKPKTNSLTSGPSLSPPLFVTSEESSQHKSGGSNSSKIAQNSHALSMRTSSQLEDPRVASSIMDVMDYEESSRVMRPSKQLTVSNIEARQTRSQSKILSKRLDISIENLSPLPERLSQPTKKPSHLLRSPRLHTSSSSESNMKTCEDWMLFEENSQSRVLTSSEQLGAILSPPALCKGNRQKLSSLSKMNPSRASKSRKSFVTNSPKSDSSSSEANLRSVSSGPFNLSGHGQPPLSVSHVDGGRKSPRPNLKEFPASPAVGSFSLTVSASSSPPNARQDREKMLRDALNFGKAASTVTRSKNTVADNDSPTSDSSTYAEEDRMRRVNKCLKQTRKMVYSPNATETSDKESVGSPSDLRRNLHKIAKTRKQRNSWYRFYADSDSSSDGSLLRRLVSKTGRISVNVEEDRLPTREKSKRSSSEPTSDSIHGGLGLFSEDEYDSEKLNVMLDKKFVQQELARRKTSITSEEPKDKRRPEVTVDFEDDIDNLFRNIDLKRKAHDSSGKESPPLLNLPSQNPCLTAYQEAVWNSFPSAEQTASKTAEEKLRETRENLRTLFVRNSHENNTDSLDLAQLLDSQVSHLRKEKNINSDLSDDDFM